MNAVYRVANLSKQGHWQALESEREWEAKTQSYLGFIAEVREIHPGMGLRAIYEQYQPEGIGRDAFLAPGRAYGLILEPMRLHSRTTSASRTDAIAICLQASSFPTSIRFG
jgi:putative transposase